jgi:GntR family transcriptional regulator/MocR family aminotransferase
VIHVGTFSKSLFPSLRLGYMLAPPGLVDTFRTIMRRFVQGVPSHTQAVTAAFIDEGHFSAHVRRMRQLYQERHDTLVDTFRARLSGLAEIVPTHGGLHTIAHLPHDLPERDVSGEADARGITASPIGRFAIAPVADNGLVLGFGGVGRLQIEAGVGVLQQVLEALSRGRALGRASRAGRR